MNIPKLIDLLERAKQDHYSEPEGLNSCPATNGRCPGPRDNDEMCDCGADAINKEIDEAIAELKAEETDCPVGLSLEPITITGPPYFEDDQPCGYCNRPIGSPHKGWCRQ